MASLSVVLILRLVNEFSNKLFVTYLHLHVNAISGCIRSPKSQFGTKIILKHQFALFNHNIFMKTNKRPCKTEPLWECHSVENIAKKNVSVFDGTPSKTIKHFSAFLFLFLFFYTQKKTHFPSFVLFLNKNALILSNNVIFHCKAF